MSKNYSSGFYSLMHEAGITSEMGFSAWLKDVVGFGNSQALDLEGFTWGEKQIGFDYEQLQIENNLKVMATYVDKDSEAIPFGTKGFTSSRGVIPRQKARYIMDEDDYRKYLLMVQNLPITGGNLKDKALDILFTNIKDIQSAHETSMTYQREQMVSNRSLVLTAENNPRGIKSLTFESSVPAANVTTLTGNARWYTDDDKSTQGSTSTPVKNVMDKIRAMKQEGFYDITIEVDEVSFLEDMAHTAWQTALGYVMTPSLLGMSTIADADAAALRVGSMASDEAVKAAFTKYTGCKVRFSKSLVATESLDSTSKKLVRKSMRAFNANTYVFYPTGNIGTIKVVAPLQPDSSALYGSILDGNGIIKYEYNPKTMVQDWWSELTALCVPNQSYYMYYLITK